MSFIKDQNTIMIKERVSAYIYRAAHADESRIKDNTLIFRERYLDSMGFILMIVFIEKEFSIKTDDEDLTEDNFESVNKITHYINQKIKQI